MYPKARLDGLSDAIFGVAMTLLVLDVRLPDDFEPHDAQALMRGLLGLMPKIFPYVLSFMVLGLRWLSNIRFRIEAETFGPGYVKWWLIYLLLITCVPFTTILVGRFPGLAPAIWLYAGNTMLIAIVALIMLRYTPPAEHDALKDRQVALVILVGTSLLAIGWSFISPSQALWALALNAVAPALSRRLMAHAAP